MAAEPGNRLLVSYVFKSTKQWLTINSIPLYSWSGVRHPLCSSPPTCRSTQNPCTTIWSDLPRGHHPRDLEVPEFDHCLLAWHLTFSSANRVWLCNLLHESKCLAPTCCAVKPATNNWGCREGNVTNILLIITKTLESRKFDYWRGCQSFCGVHLNAYDRHQGPVRIKSLRV